MKIKVLNAYIGDCIFISFYDNGTPVNILIDGGTKETYFNQANGNFGDLKYVIDEIRNKNEKIDLLILTHIDNDHICGLLEWFKNDDEAFSLIDKIWFNSGKLIAEYFRKRSNSDLEVEINNFSDSYTGIKEGINFEDFLLNNKIKVWQREIISQGYVYGGKGFKIEVISPNEPQLLKLLKKYRKETKDEAYTGSKTDDWNIYLHDFITNESENKYRFIEDSSETNGSSIAFILTVNNKKYLFLGDSTPKSIVDYLKQSYSKEEPLEVEFFKVSHHGSKANTNKELLELVKSDNYFFSTNSSGHGHPDKLTLARIVNQNPNAKFYFNYDYVKSNILSNKDYCDFKSIEAKTTNEYIVNE